MALGPLLAAPVARAQQPETPAATPREYTLTGTLRDNNGQPLELAAVGIEGQTTGTNTAADGSFRLRVAAPPAGQSLVLVVRRLG